MNTAPPTTAGSTGPDVTPVQLPYPESSLMFEKDDDGYSRPYFVCAQCRERITDAGAANVIWRVSEPLHPLIMHATCEPRALQKKFGYLHWVRLDVILVCLLKNSGVDMKKANRELARLQHSMW